MRLTNDDAELTYLAGFMDGEGCFDWKGTPRVRCSNTFISVILRLYRRFGGTVTVPEAKKGCRPCAVWEVYGKAAVECCKTLVPFLHEKRRQALILTRIQKFKPRSWQRTALRKKLTELKRVDWLERMTNL